jgi:hypothetical protein
VHTRPTDGRLLPRAQNTCNPSLHRWFCPPSTDAPCGKPQRPQARKARKTTRRTSSSWAPMTARRGCYRFVTSYLPTALAFASAFRAVSVSR